MKKEEILARIIIISFLITVTFLPFLAKQLQSKGEDVITLRARMPENGGWDTTEIHAEAGKPLLLHVTSDDVVHGFAVSGLDITSANIYPGEFTELSITFEQPGEYTYYCTQWCGSSHWRMRGTFYVSGDTATIPASTQPRYLQLELDLDAPHPAHVTPALQPSERNGKEIVNLIPETIPYLQLDVSVYSPSGLWQRLRQDSALQQLDNAELWDMVAYLYQAQTSQDQRRETAAIYSEQCAACHGETGKGDGVMVESLLQMDRHIAGHDQIGPPDFTNPTSILGASPVLLQGKIIRGGMGTGMPYWGSIYSISQIKNLSFYLYGFYWDTQSRGLP